MSTIQTVTTSAARPGMGHSLLDTLFPEAEMARNLAQTNLLLAEMTQQLAQANRGLTVTQGNVQQLLPTFNRPDNVLDVLTASQQRGYIQPILVRYVVQIPAGTTIQLTVPTPSTDVGFVMTQDHINVDPHSENFLVTGGEDGHFPTLQGVPMETALDVSGSLYFPISFRLTRTITGDPWQDIRYTETASMALVNAQFYSTILQPYLLNTLKEMDKHD